MAAKKGLGKGLDSLISDKVNKPAAAVEKPKSEHAADAIIMDINKVEPNRKTFMPPIVPQTIPFGAILQGKVSRNSSEAEQQDNVSKQGS